MARKSIWTTNRWIEYRKKQGKTNPEISYTNAEMGRRARQKYPERIRKYARDYYIRTWGQGERGTLGGRLMEIFAFQMLSLLGFSDIEYVSSYYPQLPFDFIAELNSSKIALDVTAARWKTIQDRCVRLTKILGLDYYILFIKPDKKYYQLYKIQEGKSRYYVHLRELKPCPI